MWVWMDDSENGEVKTDKRRLMRRAMVTCDGGEEGGTNAKLLEMKYLHLIPLSVRWFRSI